jgi:hypothetical protein
MIKETEYLDPSQTYTSFDIGLIACLLSRGFELLAIDKTNRRKARFVIRRDEGIDMAVRAYWDGKLSVDGRTMFDNLKMLKNRLYSD